MFKKLMNGESSMERYYSMTREELINEIKNLRETISNQEVVIEKLKQRKKAGRKEISKDIKFQAYMLHGQGKSYREISKILGISIGTISNIIKGGLNDDEK